MSEKYKPSQQFTSDGAYKYKPLQLLTSDGA